MTTPREGLAGLAGALRSRGGWQLLLGQIGPKAATTVTVLVSSALLGPDGRGQLAFVMATASLLSAMAVFGLFIPAARAPDFVPRQYLDLLLVLAVLVDLVLLGVAWVSPSGLLTFPAAAFIAANTLALALVVFTQHVLQARVSDREYFLMGAVLPLATNAILVVALLLGAEVSGYLVLWTVMNIAMAGWGVWRLARKVPLRPAVPYSGRRYLKAAAPFGVAFVASALATRGDITVLGLVSTEFEVGQYSLATSIAALLFMVSQVFTLRAASLHKSLEPEQYAAAVRTLARTAVAAVALLSVPLVGVAWLLVSWLLPEFTPSLVPMAILCLAALPETYARVHTWALGMTRNNGRLLAYSIVSVVLFVGYFLAARWGAVGVAVASVIGYSAQAFVVSFRVQWTSKNDAASDTRDDTSGADLP